MRHDPASWVLASSSPRRRRFLEAIGFECRVDPPQVAEVRLSGETPEGFAVRAAREKLADVQPRHPHAAVIAADTIVVRGTDVIGKPGDDAEARSMLRALSGRWHRVLTAVTLGTPSGRGVRIAESLVKFRELSTAEIDYYVGSGEPRDKAGAYGLQGLGAMLVERIEGSCSNVAGFPLEAFLELVEDLLGPPWTRFSGGSDLRPLWP